MSESSAALLCRRRAPRIIAQEDLELRRRGLDEPACVTHGPALEVLQHWSRALELTFVVASFEEATARMGLRVVADLVREMARIDAFITTVTRLDVRTVFEDNREQMKAIAAGFVPPPLDAPAEPNMERVVAAAKSLLDNCPIAALEQSGAVHGLEEQAHRCRLAFDGLTALVARNSQPLQSAVAAAGQAYAEGRLSIDEVAAVLGSTVPDTVALLEEQGFRRSVAGLRLNAEKRAERLQAIREERLARAGTTTARPEWVAREVIASQRIEDIDARPWLRP